MLGLGGEQPALEFSATLHHLEIQLPIFVALALRRRELLLQFFETMRNLSDVDHDNFS
jgi:hypothetical protein